MSVETHYVCDKCGAAKIEAEAGETYARINLSYEVLNERYGRHHHTTVAIEVWCKTCMEKLGMSGDLKINLEPEKPQPLASPTLEDMIRDIIHDKMAEELSNR